MRYRIFFLLFLIPAVAFSYTVVRKDGKRFSGELIRQSPEEIVIRDKQGVSLKFKSHQIDWDKTTLEIQKEERTREEARAVEKSEIQYREISSKKKWQGESLSVDFKDVDIQDFFRFIADTAGMNLILDPAVKGTLTIKMVDVPWDQILDVVCRNNGLGYEISGNVFSVQK